MLAAALTERDDSPVEDHIVVLRDATWADYQRLLEMRGDRSARRIAYLEGVIEIMSPSQPHESLKLRIGRLVEAWCLEHDIEFNAYGSWTLENKEERRGVEADECYVFGGVMEAKQPDLAIEVVWTSGGLDKLGIYRKLGVREVWFWRRGRLTVHVLQADAYQTVDASVVLPGIDLAALTAHLDRPTDSQAIRECRAHIQQPLR
jgi:Uma2 family endonuclease